MSQSPLPIALQLYTLRNLTLSFPELLAEVAAIGYKGVETTSNHGCTVDEMRALLDKNQLQVVSAHAGLPLLESDLDGVIAFNKGIGNNTLVVPWIPEAARAGGAEGWQALGRTLDGYGQRCADAGMRLLYHNHAFEMVEIEGKVAIEWLLDAAKPQNLGFEIDLAWVARGGQDGVKLLQQYTGRCPRIHCKDVAPAGQNEDQMGFADVGHGTLDWSALLPAAKAAGAEWYIVEHDLPKDALASVKRSFDFLKQQLA
ncbi:MAG: sugar phosphate isomerase/epimerase [Chloroflexi bacterium]|nr:sugar phosphate isomerase/epimerase [Chloroflexota bacterium]